MRLTVATLLLLAAPARAWEATTPADVQQRIAELQAVWQGKTPEQIVADKLQRARQTKKPSWVDRKAWKMELGPLTYYFAVGRAPRATSASAAGSESSVPARAAQPPPVGRVLDWYHDETSGTLYTLAVEAR